MIWHSASSAWRLTRCPRSASPVPSPVVPIGGAPANIGIVVHLAVQKWIESNSWMSDSPAQDLGAAIDDLCEFHGRRFSSFDNGVLTRSRVVRRAIELVDILRPFGPHLRSEVVLHDPKVGLFGILDLVSPSGSGLIVDLKTGFDGLQDTDALEFQLAIYSHLFRVRFGHLPGNITVFSFLSGSRSVAIDHRQVQRVLERFSHASKSDSSIARPDPALCKFCCKRLICSTYWESSARWSLRDSLEGVVEKVEVSSSGLYSFVIGGVALTRVLETAVPSRIVVGESIRAIFVRELGNGGSSEWVGTDRTYLKVMR